jgi:hypothetical protein
MSIIPSTPKLRRFGLVQNDAVLGSSKTTPLWAKWRSFTNFRIFFFLKKRRKLKKKKKKKEEIGVAGATPCPKNGVAGPPHFWPRGGFGHPIPAVWGWLKPPQAFGGGPATPKGQKKKKKMGFGLWGWPNHPLGPGGGFGHHLPVVGGGFGHPQALGGGPATPKGQNPFFLFFFFLAFRGGRTTPKGLGWLRPPPYGRYGVARPPRFLPFFFLLFFQKKKKKKLKPKIPKTTPF